MPNKKMKRIKMELGVGEKEEEEEDAVADEHAQQQEQEQQPSSLRRRVDEDGHAVLEMRSQIVSLRVHADTQAMELKAEIRIKDAALQANDAVLQATIQGKDALLQSKDAVIEGKNALLQDKDTIIAAKDAEIQRLRAKLAHRDAKAAVGGGARPAPAPARAAVAAAAHAPAPAPAPALAAIAVAAAAAVSAALFPFSSRADHKAPVVLLSPDRLTVTQTNVEFSAWARSERGVAAGCGVVRWALLLGKNYSKWNKFRVGVASDTFRGYKAKWPKQSWFFEDYGMIANGERQGGGGFLLFAAGDVVILELERAPGVDGVLHVRVAGKFWSAKLEGLPRDGMLYPIVCLDKCVHSYTMVALP